MENEKNDSRPVISLNAWVTDAPAGVAWYQGGLVPLYCGAWVQLQVWKLKGQHFMRGNRRTMAGRVLKKWYHSGGGDVFCDDPDAFITQAVKGSCKWKV